MNTTAADLVRLAMLFLGVASSLFAAVRIAWEFWSWGIMVLADEKPILENRPAIEVRPEIFVGAIGIMLVLVSLFLWRGGMA